MTGVLPVCPSLDTVGVFASTVSDTRLMFTHMIDARALERATNRRLARALRAGLADPRAVGLRGVRIGTVEDPVLEIVEQRAADTYAASVATVAAAGADLVAVELPSLRYAFGTALALMLGDGSVLTDIVRASADRIEGEDLRSALRIAHAIPAVLVSRADRVRRVIAREVADVFNRHRLQAFILPASVAPAIPRGAPDRTFTRADGSQEAVLWWGYPRPFYLANVTGQPSIVLPMVRESPPLGVQLVGRPHEDHTLLDIAEAVESSLASVRR